MNTKQQFGLYAAGIGALVAAIAIVTDTLDPAQLVATTVLVVGGTALYIWGQREQK